MANPAEKFARRFPLLTESAGTLVIALLILLWMANNGYRQSLVLLVSLYGFIGLGIYVPFIMGGQMSLAYNAYLGFGAYSVAIIATRTGLPMIVGFVLGVVVSGLGAIILAFATRKLNAFYLAAVTLLFSTAFADSLVDYPGVTNGAAGITGIHEPVLFGHAFNESDIVVFSVLAIWLIGMSLSILRRSSFGIALRSLREVRLAAEASGVRTSVLSIASLVLGAGIASVGGSLYTVASQAIYPDVLTSDLVFLVIFVPLLGGQRSPWGVVVGSALITYFHVRSHFIGSMGLRKWDAGLFGGGGDRVAGRTERPSRRVELRRPAALTSSAAVHECAAA